VLFCERHAAEVARGGTPCLVGRRPAAEVIARRELQMRLYLVVQITIEPRTPQPGQRPRRDRPEARHGSSFDRKAFTMADAFSQLAASACNCFRPERVIE